MADRDDDDLRQRASELGERTVLGAAPIAGGPTMASAGAFDTVGGGDLGGPGSRDPGDSTSELRDPPDFEGGEPDTGGLNEQQDQRRMMGEAANRQDAADGPSPLDPARASTDDSSFNDNNNL